MGKSIEAETQARWKARADHIRKQLGKRLQPADEPLLRNAAMLWDAEEYWSGIIARAGKLGTDKGEGSKAYKEWMRVQKEARVAYKQLGRDFRPDNIPFGPTVEVEVSEEDPDIDEFERSLS